MASSSQAAPSPYGRAKLDDERDATVGAYYPTPPGGPVLAVDINGFGMSWIRGAKLTEAAAYGIIDKPGLRVGVTYVMEDGIRYVTDFRVLPNEEQKPAVKPTIGDGCYGFM